MFLASSFLILMDADAALPVSQQIRRGAGEGSFDLTMAGRTTQSGRRFESCSSFPTLPRRPYSVEK
ncbi:hypothetical protein KNP414_07151 [Paenibacillus mucilaginosus KNP414]|uniref:Uncharacterized protein n=1 Tax=Paenibacillus mucilaginosus (strain KNP414) TaxID=1036673 RepID=F8FM35_PAEMK|nr:hypothetical protein KNP414_07151 [Paenibacillus mucilaginosus KNP414]